MWAPLFYFSKRISDRKILYFSLDHNYSRHNCRIFSIQRVAGHISAAAKPTNISIEHLA